MEEGVREHKMRLARVSPRTARVYGLNPNHHARVWCDCMFEQGARSWAMLSGEQLKNSSGHLGAFDWLGVVDLREPNSGYNLWREHVDAAAQRAAV